MKRGGAYDRSVRAFSWIYVVFGVVILAMTIARGGGPLSVGFLVGLAFIGVGIGRYMVQKRITGDEDSE